MSVILDYLKHLLDRSDEARPKDKMDLEKAICRHNEASRKLEEYKDELTQMISRLKASSNKKRRK